MSSTRTAQSSMLRSKIGYREIVQCQKQTLFPLFLTIFIIRYSIYGFPLPSSFFHHVPCSLQLVACNLPHFGTYSSSIGRTFCTNPWSIKKVHRSRFKVAPCSAIHDLSFALSFYFSSYCFSFINCRSVPIISRTKPSILCCALSMLSPGERGEIGRIKRSYVLSRLSAWRVR
jgi:hypothetical protein